jgi:release factor glutamine methyltransferase
VNRVVDTPLVVAGKAASWLAERGVESARLDAELLLAGVLGLKRLDLYLQHDRPLTAAELERYRDAVRRRGRREPLQYILGVVDFRGLALHVDPRALIPRPETEVLVGAVLDWARPAAERLGRELVAADIGTGTGAIALSLLREGPFSRVLATDVSADALALAQDNARRCSLDARLVLRTGESLAPLADETFDVLVSNPPYVGESERDALAPEVRDWEPAAALFAREGGLAVLLSLVNDGARHLREGGLLALEVGLGQAEPLADVAESTGRYTGIQVLPDLAGRPRLVLAERRPGGEGGAA